jgi:hypothetical protein
MQGSGGHDLMHQRGTISESEQNDYTPEHKALPWASEDLSKRAQGSDRVLNICSQIQQFFAICLDNPLIMVDGSYFLNRSSATSRTFSFLHIEFCYLLIFLIFPRFPTE